MKSEVQFHKYSDGRRWKIVWTCHSHWLELWRGWPFLGWKDIHIYTRAHSGERIVHDGAIMLVVEMRRTVAAGQMCMRLLYVEPCKCVSKVLTSQPHSCPHGNLRRPHEWLCHVLRSNVSLRNPGSLQ